MIGLRFADLPDDVVMRAKHSILDWLGVTLAGWRDPLVEKLTRVLAAEGGSPVATLVGSGCKASAHQAALVNGTASHALDFDDVHLPSRVHPSVVVAPAALAIAERDRCSGQALLTAFIAGVEAQSALAATMGNAHYRRGWHNTATLGMFGAAAAAGSLLRLSVEEMQDAFGIVATQAAGLRVSFGTMCKPLHAGHAAAQGSMAAALAREGFTGRSDALECADGFADMLGGDDALRCMEAALNVDGSLDPDHFHSRSIIFKYHASCYGTHAPIESALELRAKLRGTSLETLDVFVEPQYLSVCDIAVPVSPLEAKFSIRHAVALALLGYDLADGESFSGAAISDPDVANLRRRIRVVGDAGLARANARIDAHLVDGTTLAVAADASRADTDLARQARRVEAKFVICARDMIGDGKTADVIGACGHLDSLTDLAPLVAALHPAAEKRRDCTANGAGVVERI